MSYYPEPNATGLPFTNQNNWVAQGAYPQPENRVEFKLDHNFNDRQRLFGRYTFMDSLYSKPNFWGNVADPVLLRPSGTSGCKSPRLIIIQNFGTRMVLNIRYGLGRVSGNRVPGSASLTGNSASRSASLGLPSYRQHLGSPGLPSDDHHPGYDAAWTQQRRYLFHGRHHAQRHCSAFRAVSGRHSMKYGLDFRKNFVNYGQLSTPERRVQLHPRDDPGA